MSTETFTYRGFVYYRGAADCERLETTITIAAPNAETADAIVRHYGLDSIKRERRPRRIVHGTAKISRITIEREK